MTTRLVDFSVRFWRLVVLLVLALTCLCDSVQAQAPQPASGQTINTPLFKVNVTPRDIGDRGSVNSAIQVLAVMTMLTLAPSIIFLMTSFTRIVIVLSFIRSALSLQGGPANQIIIGLSLFMTYFIMEPVWSKINSNAARIAN